MGWRCCFHRLVIARPWGGVKPTGRICDFRPSSLRWPAMMTHAYPSRSSLPLRGHAPAGPSAFLGRAALLAGILTLLILPAGCRKKTSLPLRHAPAGGAQPVRIACTVPAATQILLQLGAARDLVGVSSFDRPLLPPPLQSLPIVGNYLHLDYETLLNLQPTVLVVQMAPTRLPLSLTHFARRRSPPIPRRPTARLRDRFAPCAVRENRPRCRRATNRTAPATSGRNGRAGPARDWPGWRLQRCWK